MTPTLSADRTLSRLCAVALLLCVLSILWFQATLLRSRTFDPDEFQHAHNAYLISKGQLPYADYFEHHPPAYHFLMAPLVRGLRPDRATGNAFEALFSLRLATWSLALLGFLLHHVLARRVVGALGASLASLLLASTVMVFEKTMEIRPDNGAFLLLQGGLLLLVGPGSLVRTVLGFSLLGLAVLFTPKVVFPILGIVVARGLVRVEGMSRGRQVAAALVGLAWPGAACASYFLARGALGPFVEQNLLVNLRWKAHLAVWPFLLSRFLTPNPFFAALSILGLGQGARRGTVSAGTSGERMVFLSALGGVVGLLALPVAWEQYYLLFLPQLAIVASGGLLDTLGRLLRRDVSSPAVAMATLIVVGVGLLPSKGELERQGMRTDERKERAIRMVLDNLPPDEPVLDGYSGIGVFRPHAFSPFFLHAEVRQMLDEEAILRLEQGLAAGTLGRHVASADAHLSAVSPRVREILARDFEVVGEGPVTARLYPGGTAGWDDTRVREVGLAVPREGAYVLCGPGWSEREVRNGRAFRRSRGRNSTLVFPVLDPEPLSSISLMARAGADVEGLSAEVTLNGEPLGSIELGPVFTSSSLALAPGSLRRGLNRLELSYPRRPAQIDPVKAELGNETLALANLTLDRGSDPP